MPLVKGRLIKHFKVIEDNGGIIEMKLWQVPKSKEKPHGFKYSLVYISNGVRIIGYDNAEGKGDHCHYWNCTEEYSFAGVKKLVSDFYNDVNKFKKGLL